MTSLIVYAIVAVLIMVVAGVLLRPDFGRDSNLDEFSGEYSEGLWEGTNLTAVEKIFDRTDYLWLRDKVGFPSLARSLARTRKQIALKWLKALRRSFDDVVLAHAAAPEQAKDPDGPGTWDIFWPMLRFHLLLTYATLVVRWFGPYHRLIPPLMRLKQPSQPYLHRERYGSADLGNLH
jgi:hypothetical protein